MIKSIPGVSYNLMMKSSEANCFNSNGQCDFINMLAMMMQNKSLPDKMPAMEDVSGYETLTSSFPENIKLNNLLPGYNLKNHTDLALKTPEPDSSEDGEDFDTFDKAWADYGLAGILGTLNSSFHAAEIIGFNTDKPPDVLDVIPEGGKKPATGINLDSHNLLSENYSQYPLPIYNSAEGEIKLGYPEKNFLYEDDGGKNITVLKTTAEDSPVSFDTKEGRSFSGDPLIKEYTENKFSDGPLVKNKSDFEEAVINANFYTDGSQTIIEGKNKIIQVSDESAEIRPDLLSQIEDKIIFMSREKEGIQEITMELHPKNLGKVNIRMSVEAERITVELSSLNKETDKILISNIRELTNVLADTAKKDVNIYVDSHNFNFNQQGDINYNNPQKGRERNGRSHYNDDLSDERSVENTMIELINLQTERLNRVV